MSKRILAAMLAVILLVAFTTTGFAQLQKADEEEVPAQMSREDIPEQYKWNLGDIYPDWETWEKDLGKVQELMEEYKGFEGKLDEGPETILKAMKLSDELGMLAYKVYQYPGLMYQTDMRANDVQAKLQQVQILFARFGQATAWFTPELLTIPQETMEEWIEETPELEPYEFNILDTYRQAEHTLSADKEQLLSYFGPATGGGAEYSALSTADVEFPEVTLSDGTKMKATHGNYEYSRFSHKKQEDRKAMFLGHISTYDDFENTYAAIYNSTLQSGWAYTQARSYESSAQRALDGNNIPVEVMTNLIETAKNGAGELQRYMELRQKAMGLEEYYYFDSYRPLVDLDLTFEYEDVRPMIVESVKPFGKDYQKTVDRAFDERWFDVYENDGKRSGAFSAGVYGVHPYMLLNYTDTMDDAFTLAHEMGHTMHTVLSHENQPFVNSSYTIFVAEVASTVGEMFFLDYLLEEYDDPMVRIALLQKAIDNIHTTFYRQAMFADFEYKAHKAVQDGQPITAQVLQQMYLESYKDFFGDSHDGQDLYRNLWARISHFQRPFYVYQYATCIAGGTQLHEKMTEGSRKERKAAVENFLALLKSGGNDFPMEQLKKAGVDWTTPGPAEAMVEKMKTLVDQLEKELKKADKI
jgi:oligoendopeptidase F